MRWLLRTPGAAKEAEGEAAGGRRKRRAGAPKHRPREDPAETRDGQGAFCDTTIVYTGFRREGLSEACCTWCGGVIYVRV